MALILILDLDGVLITTPPWKADQMDTDGYSMFNKSCLSNLNKLFSLYNFEIWLSSTRRTAKSVEEFNVIFKHRNISKPIEGFLPIYPNCNSRKEEILAFIEQYNFSDFLIIDDDKSLNGLDEVYKEKLALTDPMNGFDQKTLEIVLDKMKSRKDAK